jgi:hypothetical protein
MTSRSPRYRRWLIPAHLLLAALAGYALLLPACASWDGHLNILGYTTHPNYDMRFKSIRVQMFRNRTPWNLTPAPGLEMDLTRAVVREIEWKTPYKVISTCNAETELRGTIVSFTKNLLNYTQFNTIREAETDMTVELIWRDTRTGEILTKAARRYGQPPEPEPRQPLLSPDQLATPGTKPIPVIGPPVPQTSGVISGGGEVEQEIIDPLTRKKANPVIIRSTAYFRPELGESLTTAMQQNVDRMAVQIISAMEKSW